MSWRRRRLSSQPESTCRAIQSHEPASQIVSYVSAVCRETPDILLCTYVGMYSQCRLYMCFLWLICIASDARNLIAYSMPRIFSCYPYLRFNCGHPSGCIRASGALRPCMSLLYIFGHATHPVLWSGVKRKSRSGPKTIFSGI